MGEANILSHIALIHFQLDDRDRALEHYQQAINVHRAAGNSEGEAVDLSNLQIVANRLLFALPSKWMSQIFDSH